MGTVIDLLFAWENRIWIDGPRIWSLGMESPQKWEGD